MKQAIIKTLKTLFSDVRQTIISLAILALVGSTWGLLYLSKTALNLSIEILNISTPLWATTLLVLLCCLYTYLKYGKFRSSSSSETIIKYFTIGNYKWETEIYESGYFNVGKYPYCIKHDLKVIFGRDGKHCPGTENERCDNKITGSDFFNVYETAKSRIGNVVRNKNFNHLP
jgi:hypothetical protein